MRVSESISWALVVASSLLSVVLWRDLRTERQLVADLHTQQDKAGAAAQAANCPVQAAAPVIPDPSATPPAPADCPAVPPARSAQEAASAARLAEVAQRQNALQGDPEYQKARLATARSNVQSRYPGLALDLGLSEKEADTLFTILAESALRQDAELTGRVASGTMSESALLAEMSRLQKEQIQQQKDAIVARLGAERYAGFQEYEETRPARGRVTNFSGMLMQRGVPLTPAQSKSLTTVMITEQRRQESDAQSKPADPSARAEREIESDRRIVAAAANFLDPQQVGLIKAKFDELAEGKRASSILQQRMIESQAGATGGK